MDPNFALIVHQLECDDEFRRDLDETMAEWGAEEARKSFEAISREAYEARVEIPLDGCTIIVDGQAYSSSSRVCPGAEHVYQDGNVAAWLAFDDELDQFIEAYAESGYHLGWESGCLYLYGPQYCPED